ncbi:MAG: TraC family protein [Candidatus Paceibacterota bacterium]|jgi:type IV secretory pathway VirB4 component
MSDKVVEKIISPPNSTQRFVDVEEIKNGVVVLKGGALRAVIMVSGVNFELKSEDEQDIITSTYQDFLNSLDFSLQIVIHSRKLNIENYLKKMEEIRNKESSELLRNQIDEYVSFIRSFVKENEIMTKNFFVVVPYEAAGAGEIKKGFFGLFGSKKSQAKEKQESFDQMALQLQQRVDQAVSGLERIGLRAVALNDDELVELYYNLYNPETVEKELPKSTNNK